MYCLLLSYFDSTVFLLCSFLYLLRFYINGRVPLSFEGVYVCVYVYDAMEFACVA